jgi:hypothetical protein
MSRTVSEAIDMTTLPTANLVPPPLELNEADRTHLKVLSILYYVWGGLAMLGLCGGLIYIVVGAAVAGAASIPTTQPQGPPVAVVGGFFIAIGACVSIFAATLGGLNIYVGRCLSEGRCLTLCQVMAALNCISIPAGTLLGVFTLIVLARPSVAAYFNRLNRPR